MKQLAKLVKVRYVEDITNTHRIGERGARGSRCGGMKDAARSTSDAGCRNAGCGAGRDRICCPALLLLARTHASCDLRHTPALQHDGASWRQRGHVRAGDACCAEREMVLMKLRAPPGPARTEVLQLAQIFRARITDVSEYTLTVCVSGDPGKVRLFVGLVVEGSFGRRTRQQSSGGPHGVRALL